MRRTALVLAVAVMATAPAASAAQRLTFRQARAEIHRAWGQIEIDGCRRRSATRITCGYRVLLLVSTPDQTTREWMKVRDVVYLDRRGRVHDATLSTGGFTLSA